MSFTFHSGRIVANGRVQALAGRRVIGGYDLLFNIDLHVLANRPEWGSIVMSEWTATVSCGRVGQPLILLGTARPQFPTHIQSFEFDNPTYLGLVLELTPQKLAGLEEARAGGDLVFQLTIGSLGKGRPQGFALGADVAPAERDCPEQILPVNDTINHTVRLTEWAQILEQLGYRRLMIFSLDIPFGPVQQQFEPAHQLLGRARDQLIQGDFDGVVSLCRKIMDSLAACTGETEQVRSATAKYREGRQEREAMSKRERGLLVQEAVRHYTHLAHHVAEGNGAPEWYSRGDATFSLALATAVFAEAVARHGSGSPST